MLLVPRSKEVKFAPLGSDACVDQKTFEANWKTYHGGLLDGFDWSNVFAAGGGVVSSLVRACWITSRPAGRTSTCSSTAPRRRFVGACLEMPGVSLLNGV